MIKVNRIAADRYVVALTADDKHTFYNIYPSKADTHELAMEKIIKRGLLELSRESLVNRSTNELD